VRNKMKSHAVYWLVAAFVINFFAVGSFIWGVLQSLCGISFSYVASHSFRLAILAQEETRSPIIVRSMRFLKRNLHVVDRRSCRPARTSSTH